MLELILEPTKFFHRKKEEKPRPWAAFLYAFVAILLNSLAFELATRNLPSPMGFAGPVKWLVYVAAALVVGLVIWGVLGLIIHLLTGLGARAFELAGWTFVPSVVTALVALAVAAVFPVQGDLPPYPEDPRAMGEWIRAYNALVQSSLFSRVNLFLDVASGLWSAALLYLGLKVLAPKRAVLVTAVYLLITFGLFFLTRA